VAASQELARGRFLPQRVASKVRATSGPAVATLALGKNPITPATTCDDCDSNYNQCVELCDGRPGCLQRCERQYQRCLDNCECQPYSQIVTEDQFVNYDLVDWNCYQINWDPHGFLYSVYFIKIKRTRKQITYNCDGSQTVQILDVTY